MELESQIIELKEKYKKKIDDLRLSKTDPNNNETMKEMKKEKKCELCPELKTKLNLLQNNYDSLLLQSKEKEKVKQINK